MNIESLQFQLKFVFCFRFISVYECVYQNFDKSSRAHAYIQTYTNVCVCVRPFYSASSTSSLFIVVYISCLCAGIEPIMATNSILSALYAAPA